MGPKKPILKNLVSGQKWKSTVLLRFLWQLKILRQGESGSQPMVRHTQTIHPQKLLNYLSVFDHGLTSTFALTQDFQLTKKPLK